MYVCIAFCFFFKSKHKQTRVDSPRIVWMWVKLMVMSAEIYIHIYISIYIYICMSVHFINEVSHICLLLFLSCCCLIELFFIYLIFFYIHIYLYILTQIVRVDKLSEANYCRKRALYIYICTIINKYDKNSFKFIYARYWLGFLILYRFFYEICQSHEWLLLLLGFLFLNKFL